MVNFLAFAGTMQLMNFWAVHMPYCAWSICNTAEVFMLAPEHGKIRSWPFMLSGAGPFPSHCGLSCPWLSCFYAKAELQESA